jgi:hypothetical protein
VIEPRKHNRWERPPYANADAAPSRRTGLSAKVPPGSKSGAGYTREVRQEPGRSTVSVEDSGGPPMIGSRSRRAVLVRREANKSTTTVTNA